MPHRITKVLAQREDLAIQFYMQGMTKKDSLIKAGYAVTTARGNPESVYNRPRVAQELERRQLALREKSQLSEEWVIKRLMMLADAGAILAKFKKVTPTGGLKWDFAGATEEELACINELTVTVNESEDGKSSTRFKIGHSDPAGALVSLARVQGMFKDKVQFEGELSLVDRITRGRERARIIEHEPDES